MFDNLGVEVPAQPDGGEVRTNRKGVAARWGLKEVGSDSRGLMDKNRSDSWTIRLLPCIPDVK
jgi:hypothetical protein